MNPNVEVISTIEVLTIFLIWVWYSIVRKKKKKRVKKVIKRNPGRADFL